MEQGLVSADSLERELSRAGAAAGAQSGAFGPGSLTWQVDREAAVFLIDACYAVQGSRRCRSQLAVFTTDRLER